MSRLSFAAVGVPRTIVRLLPILVLAASGAAAMYGGDATKDKPSSAEFVRSRHAAAICALVYPDAASWDVIQYPSNGYKRGRLRPRVFVKAVSGDRRVSMSFLWKADTNALVWAQNCCPRGSPTVAANEAEMMAARYADAISAITRNGKERQGLLASVLEGDEYTYRWRAPGHAVVSVCIDGKYRGGLLSYRVRDPDEPD